MSTEKMESKTRELKLKWCPRLVLFSTVLCFSVLISGLREDPNRDIKKVEVSLLYGLILPYVGQ